MSDVDRALFRAKYYISRLSTSEILEQPGQMLHRIKYQMQIENILVIIFFIFEMTPKIEFLKAR